MVVELECHRPRESVLSGERGRCPVAHSAYRNWTVFRHADTVRILDDPDTFSNAVSSHLSVPNGMDPPEHTPFRAINDR